MGGFRWPAALLGLPAPVRTALVDFSPSKQWACQEREAAEKAPSAQLGWIPHTWRADFLPTAPLDALS
jgi:hypothetical protein